MGIRRTCTPPAEGQHPFLSLEPGSDLESFPPKFPSWEQRDLQGPFWREARGQSLAEISAPIPTSQVPWPLVQNWRKIGKDKVFGRLKEWRIQQSPAAGLNIPRS